MTASLSFGTVVALAGRRIDAPGAVPQRFPLGNADRVRTDLEVLLVELQAVALVCSAANGADLLALDAAGHAALRRRIVLPFDAERFRITSVIDRPGPWGGLFDSVMQDVRERGDLVVLAGETDLTAAYAAATARILDEAEWVTQTAERHGELTPVAVAVWDGHRRGGDDATSQFASLARRRGWSLHEVDTL